MNADEASRIILKPYITEKTFAMIESESKICFIVNRSANKRQITDAIVVLYGAKPAGINTTRTLYGKKAFARFETTEKARDLATKIGML